MRQLPTKPDVAAFVDDDDHMYIVHPCIVEFVPIKGSAFCACGRELRQWQYGGDGDWIELVCDHCHRTLARLQLGTEVEDHEALEHP